MSAVSEELPPRRIASSTPAQVDPDSAVAEQLTLMNSLAEGEISGAAFATGWLAARNRAMAEGERTRGALDRVLTDVFYALEDYVIDPALREPGDLPDHELTSRVRAALDTLRSLEAPPPDSQVL